MHITLQSREFSIQNPILHAEDKELFEYYYYYIQRAKRPSVQKGNSTHRRQGDLLEIHPCVLQDIPGIQPQDLPKASSYHRHSSLSRHSRHSSLSRHSRHSRDIPDIPVFPVFPDIPDTPETFRTFQSFMTLQPLQVILQVPVFPGNPTHSSILQLECIFYIFYVFYIFYSSIGFHGKLHRVPVEQLQTLQIANIHSSKKGRCCDISQTCIGKDVKMTYFLE